MQAPSQGVGERVTEGEGHVASFGFSRRQRPTRDAGRAPPHPRGVEAWAAGPVEASSGRHRCARASRRRVGVSGGQGPLGAPTRTIGQTRFVMHAVRDDSAKSS